MKYIPLIAMLLSLLSCSAERIIKVSRPLNEGVQYQKTEWDITLTSTWENPYDQNQIALDMLLIAPSGVSVKLPCYYESGKSGEKSMWKARFTPIESGEYKIHFVLNNQGRQVAKSPSKNFVSKQGTGRGFLRANNDWSFRYDNGQVFRAIGENICWESRDEDDSRYFKKLHEDKRFNYDYMVGKLAANGGNFFRTWLIYWNLPIDWKKVDNNSRYTSSEEPYNRSAMERMDKLVELCDSLGVHCMFALQSHVSLMGSGWANSNYNIANGGSATSPTDFFALQSARDQYKNFLRLMIARYGYSPSVGVWEFFNEVDNAMYQRERISDEIVCDWHREMSDYLKANDPYNHLVSTSVSHRDVEGMNSLENIDFNQRHIYGNTAGIPSTINDYRQRFAKPYVIGEQGYHWDWSMNFNDYAAEFDHDFRQSLWLGLFSPTPILPMSWWWEFFESRGMMEYFQLVGKINERMIASGEGKFDQTVVQVAGNVTGLGVQCGLQTFIYLHNNDKKGSYQTSVTVAQEGQYQIESFNTTNGEFTPLAAVTTDSKQLTLPTVELENRQDIILICKPL